MRLRTKRAVEFACTSKACAPPPVGTGGSNPSKGGANTSVVPRDVRRKVAGSDNHAEAPGSNDPRAVRAYRGVNGDEAPRRIPRAGETVDLYRDLGRGREHKRGFPDHDAFSVRLSSGKDGNSTTLVQASTVGLVLKDGRPAWADSAKKAAEVEGRRGVHAFVRGEVEQYVTPAQGARMIKEPGWEKVTYYPGTQDFFRPSDRARWTGAEQVVLVKGEFFAKNAKFVTDNPAPVSPIEKKMGLTASVLDWTDTIDFACHSKACAPPPVGTGGSKPGGFSGFDGTAASVPRDIGRIMSIVASRPTSGGKEMQETIYDNRPGFHGKARVVSRDEFHDLADSGAVREGWRAVQDLSAEGYISRDLIDGKTHYVGWGVIGNGTYVAESSSTASAREEATLYGDSFLRIGLPKSVFDVTSDTLAEIQTYLLNMDYYENAGKGVKRFDPDDENWKVAKDVYHQGIKSGLTNGEILSITQDLGRLGSLLGLDGYYMNLNEMSSDRASLNYVVVLNRSAITLDRTVYHADGITPRFQAPGYDERGEKL